MNQTVIDLLNQGRARELTAIGQYMAQHYELDDAMYGKLADRAKAIAIMEMKHAEALAERVLFLGGVPSSKPDTAILKKQSIPDLLKTDIGLEAEAVRLYNESATVCAKEGDVVSRALFERLAGEEEAHLDEFENTADFVSKLGAAYLATLVS
jgi:bacterioferritin